MLMCETSFSYFPKISHKAHAMMCLMFGAKFVSSLFAFCFENQSKVYAICLMFGIKIFYAFIEKTNHTSHCYLMFGSSV